MKWILSIVAFLSLGLLQQDQYKALRERMVNDQIKSRGIKDEATLEAMKEVPRHYFVPESERSAAYADRPLPIGYGQTISQPYIVAYMTEMLELQPGHKVLEIGTGSGYQAAVLSRIAKKVYTIEIVEPLGQAARERLTTGGFSNVEVKLADGFFGWEEKGPFDAIMVTAAAEFIPPPLIKQLKNGGKMIIPVGSPFQMQFLMMVEKNDQGKVKTYRLLPVRFVPFTRK